MDKYKKHEHLECLFLAKFGIIIGLDSYNKIPMLVELAHNYDLGSTIAWLKNNWLD